MNAHEKINYVEFPAQDIEVAKSFFTTVFGWSFLDYGPEYTAFSDEGLDGGFLNQHYRFQLKTEVRSLFFTVTAWSRHKQKLRPLAVLSYDPYFLFPVVAAFTFVIPTGMSMRFGQIKISKQINWDGTYSIDCHFRGNANKLHKQISF